MFVFRRPLLITSRFLSSAAKLLEIHGVVPDVIDVAPEQVTKVIYSGGVMAHLGNILTPTQVKDMPRIVWEASKNTFYTLCMTDPDAPSRKEPTYREWHHWLIVNIPENMVDRGDVLSEYIGSGPPLDTGFHRYVFLVFRQNGKITCDEKRLTNKSGENRGGFSIRKFATKYKLGDPVAANLYLAQYDNYVPILYKQLGA